MDEPKRIFGTDHYIYCDGHVENSHGETLRTFIYGNGFVAVTIKRKKYLVHRLVAQEYLGYSRKIVIHIDGNKKNNSLDNLRYQSKSDSVIARQRTAKSLYIPTSDETANLIRRHIRTTTLNNEEIASIFNVPIFIVQIAREILDKSLRGSV